MSFNFKDYVRGLLVEQKRMAGANMSAVDATNYREDPPTSGIFVTTTDKDPYSYRIISSDAQKTVIKVVAAPSGRQSAVGQKFDITTNNLDNPNVQLLYASLLNLGKITRLTGDEGSFKIGSFTAEVLIVGQDFAHENHFKEQHDKIKHLGHENANSTLVDHSASLGVLSPVGSTLSLQINDMVQEIEQKSAAQVVSLVIFPGSVRYMAKENTLKYVKDVFEIDDVFKDKVREYISKLDDASEISPSGESTIIVDSTARDHTRSYYQDTTTRYIQRLEPEFKQDKHDSVGCILAPHPNTIGSQFRDNVKFCLVKNEVNKYTLGDTAGQFYKMVKRDNIVFFVAFDE